MLVLSARRYLRMLKMAEDPKNVFYFSPDHVIDYCWFGEQLRHFEPGLWEFNQIDAQGKVDPRIILEPWQIWIEAAIHGFRRRITNERLVITALEVVPRKNAKSLKAVIAILYDLCCGGLSPSVVVAAATGKQVEDTVWGDVIQVIGNEPELVEQFKIHPTRDKISSAVSGGSVIKLSSQGERQDGLNPSLALFEEGHAGAASVWKVVDSAFGARPNALKRMITTAGYRPEGPGYELYLDAQLILEGKDEDYSIFAAIYELDRDDYVDPESQAIDFNKLFSTPELIAKANPMYGISLDPVKMQSDMQKAKRRPDLRGEAARTRFNIWTGSGMALIEAGAWAACRRNIDLGDFFGKRCWIGIDLASKLDMCSIGLVFEMPNDGIAVFAKYFLPEQSPLVLDPDIGDILMSWAQDGHITLTDGPLADHRMIVSELSIYAEVFDVQTMAFDMYQAHDAFKTCWDNHLPACTYPNKDTTMTGPVDDILSLMVAGRLAHDGNPVLAWNASNVHGDKKGNGLILPRKESKNSKRKIDGFVAICFADGVRLNPDFAKEGADRPKVSAYDRNKRIIGAERSA